MTLTCPRNQRGFTLIELLVVIAIIGILASVVLMSLEQSRQKGRDAARKLQVQEILKALELHYSDGLGYPTDGTPADGTSGDAFSNIGSGFIGGPYIGRLPEEPERYYYCSSGDGKSMVLAVNTEDDDGGSDFCQISRGDGATLDGFGCNAWLTANGGDECSTRF